MSYAGEGIVLALKEAREAQGLSQRDLSERVGVPQSHISKIERGKADIRLSSLIELTRALGLDLKLVPKKAVPAVNQVVRNASPMTIDAPLQREMKTMLKKVRAIKSVYPYMEEIKQLAKTFESLQQNLGTLSKDNTAAFDQIRKSIADAQHVFKQSGLDAISATDLRAMQETARIARPDLEGIMKVARQAQEIRNSIAHMPPIETFSRPAYSLDEE